MDYKKKYKEANDKVAIRFGTNVAKEIFTDLYESEDEKIRKALVRFHKSSIDIDGIKGEDILAWLEKQGEQKPFDYENANIQQKDFAPKVEPKFKVGDWIVYYRNDSSREVLQIYDIRDSRYYFNDNVHFSWSIKECDEKSHLWTIQDAKDGDVLYCESSGIEYIIILKQINNRSLDSYCRYNTIDGFAIDVPRVMSIQDNPKPATKEQRDTLMKAMADAGWEFDFEKKELKLLITNGGDFDTKNCEQNPAWGYEDEANLNNIIWLCNNCIKGSETTWIPAQAKKIKHLIETIKEIGLVQQTSAWSEEDEKILNTTISFLSEYAAKGYENAVMCMDWLKSLKDRIGG